MKMIEHHMTCSSFLWHAASRRNCWQAEWKQPQSSALDLQSLQGLEAIRLFAQVVGMSEAFPDVAEDCLKEQQPPFLHAEFPELARYTANVPFRLGAFVER